MACNAHQISVSSYNIYSNNGLKHTLRMGRSGSLRACGLLLCLGLGACTSAAPPDRPLGEELLGLSAGQELLRFHAGAPQHILERRSISGLAHGEQLVGLDYRVARSVLFALADSGRLYTLDVSSGAAHPVGSPQALPRLHGPGLGFDFNPAADRIRVVTAQGQNLRLHPDTGQQVDGDATQPGVQPDPALRYAWGDMHAGRTPHIVAAGYTYNQRDDKLTTNYAIDAALGTLVLQGSREGAQPVVSPNTGQLRTVGPLGLGPLVDASFDISDVRNAALLAARTSPQAPTVLYRVDLDTGRASALGVVGDGAPLRGLAIVP